MTKQEEIREKIRTTLWHFGQEFLHTRPDDSAYANQILTYLCSQGAVLQVKCPDCEWSQFVDEESVGMTPCHSCNSTGYLIEPLIKEG